MSDKTRLELDIEHHERYRAPINVKIFMILLFATLCFVGVYAFHLKQELSRKEQELVLMKDNFQKERVELLGKIKQLEAETTSMKSKK